MRINVNRDVDPATLSDQLSATLGMPVAVATRRLGQKDDKGNDLPGVVVLLDSKTGEPLPDQDSVKVAAVIAAHVPPPPAKTPHKALADALGSAANLGDLKAALVAFAGTVADREDKARQRDKDRRAK